MRKKICYFSIITITLFLTLTCYIIGVTPKPKNANNIITIGKYKGLELQKINPNVTNEEIEKEIEHELTIYSIEEEVLNREIQHGDIVNFTYTIYENGNIVPEYQNVTCEIVVGDNEFNKQVEDSILGLTKGDSKQILTTSFGNINDYFANKEITIDICINKITTLMLPKLTEEFLMDKYGVKTQEEFYNIMKKQTTDIVTNNILNKQKEALIKSVINNTKFSKNYYELCENRYNELIKQYISYGKLYNMTLDETLDSLNLTKKEIHDNAVFFEGCWEVTQYIIEVENLSLSATAKTEKAKEYIKEYGYTSIEDFISDNGQQYLDEEIYKNIVLDYIYQNAKIIY